MAPPKSPRSTSATESPWCGRRGGDPGPDHAASDHEEVELALPERGQGVRATGQIQSGFVQARRPDRVGDLDAAVRGAARPARARPR